MVYYASLYKVHITMYRIKSRKAMNTKIYNDPGLCLIFKEAIVYKKCSVISIFLKEESF